MTHYCEWDDHFCSSSDCEVVGELCGKVAHFKVGNTWFCADHYDEIVSVNGGSDLEPLD